MNAKKPPEDPPYQLFCKFLDESLSFCLGFEIGGIAHRLHTGESPIEDSMPVHTANAAQLRLLAEAYGYDIELTTHREPLHEWSQLRMWKKVDAPSKPSRHLRSI